MDPVQIGRSKLVVRLHRFRAVGALRHLNLGFGAAELRRVQRLVVENRALLLEKWHERFPS